MLQNNDDQVKEFLDEISNTNTSETRLTQIFKAAKEFSEYSKRDVLQNLVKNPNTPLATKKAIADAFKGNNFKSFVEQIQRGNTNKPQQIG